MTPQIRKQKVLRPVDSTVPARMRRRALRVTRRFGESPQRVFGAWLDPDLAGQWLFATALRPMTHVAIDARVGGAFCFADRRNGERIEFTGEYTEIIPQRRLVFNLTAADDPRVVTRVIVEITARKSGCEIELIQEECRRTTRTTPESAGSASSTDSAWRSIRLPPPLPIGRARRQ